MGRWTYVSNDANLELPDSRHKRPDGFTVSSTIQAKLAADDGGKKRLLPIVKQADPPFDSDTQGLRKTADVITQTEVQIGNEVFALDTTGQVRQQKSKRLNSLRPSMQPIFDKIRPTGVSPTPGQGLKFDDLTNVEKTKLLRWMGLTNGFDA